MARKKNFSIDISDEAMTIIKNELVGKATDVMTKEGEEGSLELKKIAYDYIEVAKEYEQKIQEFTNNMKLAKKFRDTIHYSDRKNVSDEDRKDIEDKYSNFLREHQIKMASEYNFNKFFEATLTFNHKILTLINEKETRITFVLEEEKGKPIVVDFSLEDVLSGQKGVKIYATYSKTGNLIGKLTYNIKEMQKAYEKAEHKDPRMTDLNALEKLREARNESVRIYDNHSPFLFWYIPPKEENGWQKARVGGGKGDISQAYSYFYYNKNKYETVFKIGKLYDKNLHIYITEGIKKVDNISGLWRSDVQIADHMYDYAVKAASASLPGFSQMITLALDILNNKVKSVKQLKDKAKLEIEKGEEYLKDKPRLEIEKVIREAVPMDVLENIQGI